MLLPGQQAARVRRQAAELLVRYLGVQGRRPTPRPLPRPLPRLLPHPIPRPVGYGVAVVVYGGAAGEVCLGLSTET